MAETTKTSNWIKLSKLIPKDGEVAIQLLNEVSKPRFALWDVRDNKYVNEGQKITTSKGELEVNKFIKLSDLPEEEKKRWSRKEEFIRDVVVNGEKKILPLPKTAEAGVLNVMQTIKQLGKDPLSMTYVIKKTESQGITKYEVRVGTPVPVAQLNTHRVEASKDELTVIDAIKSDPIASKRMANDKVKILLNNGISEQRAKELVASYF